MYDHVVRADMFLWIMCLNVSGLDLRLSLPNLLKSGVNPLAPGKLERHFRYVIFKRILVVDG